MLPQDYIYHLIHLLERKMARRSFTKESHKQTKKTTHPKEKCE